MMRLLTGKTLDGLARKHPAAEAALSRFERMVKVATWRSLTEIKDLVPNASPVPPDRVVFDIGAQGYRLICSVRLCSPEGHGGVVWVKWFGTHAEYDRIDASTATLF